MPIKSKYCTFLIPYDHENTSTNTEIQRGISLGFCSPPCSRDPCWPPWFGSWWPWWTGRSSYVLLAWAWTQIPLPVGERVPCQPFGYSQCCLCNPNVWITTYVVLAHQSSLWGVWGISPPGFLELLCKWHQMPLSPPYFHPWVNPLWFLFRNAKQYWSGRAQTHGQGSLQGGRHLQEQFIP